MARTGTAEVKPALKPRKLVPMTAPTEIATADLGGRKQGGIPRQTTLPERLERAFPREPVSATAPKRRWAPPRTTETQLRLFRAGEEALGQPELFEAAESLEEQATRRARQAADTTANRVARATGRRARATLDDATVAALRQIAPTVGERVGKAALKGVGVAAGIATEIAFPNQVMAGEPGAIALQERVDRVSALPPSKLQTLLTLDEAGIRPDDMLDAMLGASDDARLNELLGAGFTPEDALAYEELQELLNDPQGAEALDFAFNPPDPAPPVEALLDPFEAATSVAVPGAFPVAALKALIERK